MKKKIIEIIGIIISIIIIFQNIAYATSSKSSLQNQQSDIDNQIKELENEQKEIQANKSETMKSVEDLIYQISDVENEIDARACIEAAEDANAPLILDVIFAATPDIYFFGQELSKNKLDIDKYMDRISKVNKENVVDIANKVSVNTVYFLKN